MDRTLDAEMHAARTSARRRRSLRDRLLDAEDGADRVTVTTVGGGSWTGTVEAVGVDHVDLAQLGARRTIAIEHIAVIEASG